MSYSLVFAREMILDETELKTHLKKIRLERWRGDTTAGNNRAGGSAELGEMSDVRSGSLCLMTTLHRGHALLHLTR
jgi:hypothetical protein